jgi:hypothetical protein
LSDAALEGLPMPRCGRFMTKVLGFYTTIFKSID